MEAATRKIEFGHNFVTLQAIEYVAAVAKKKLQSAGQYGKSNTELDFLWKHCSNPSSAVIGRTCASAITSLVADDILDGNAVLATTVNNSSSACTVEWLLEISGEVFALHIRRQIQSYDGQTPYRCPYSLHDLPHPLISILNSKPHSWTAVSGQLRKMLSMHQEKSHFLVTLELMKPVLLYVLQNPSASDEITLEKCNLYDQLFSMCIGNNDSCVEELMTLLWRTLSYTKVSSNNTRFFKMFCEMSVNNISTSQPVRMQTAYVLLKLLSYCNKEVNSSAISVTQCIDLMINTLHSLGRLSIEIELCFVGIAKMMFDCPVSSTLSLLSLLDVLLQYKTPSQPCLLMVTIALLPLSLFTSTKTLNAKDNRLLKNLLSKVAVLIREMDTHGSSNNEEHDDMFSNLFLVDEWILGLNSSLHLVKHLCSSEFAAKKWLSTFKHLLSNTKYNDDDVREVTSVHCILLLHYLGEKSSHCVRNILQNLTILTRNFPRVVYFILPVFLFAIKTCNSALQIKKICYALPKLATHSYCVPPILNTIRSLSSDPRLKPMSIRLMLDLWLMQDGCFPQLQKMLLSHDIRRLGELSGIPTYHASLMKAVSLSVICEKRPYQHGSDALKLISSILESDTPGRIGSVRKYQALDGLYHLCENKIINMKTMWDQLGERLIHENDSIALKKILDILSLVPLFKADSQQYECFKESMLEFVWLNVFQSNSKNSLVASAALGCLAKYDFKEFKVKHLPPSVQPEGTEEDVDLEKAVPGSCFVELIVKSLDAASHETFLSSIMKQESSDLPRDIHQRAMKSCSNTAHPKALQELPKFMLMMYEKNRQPALKPSLAVSLLMCHTPEDPSQTRKPSLAAVISYGRNCMEILQALLNEVNVDPNSWQGILWCCHGWKAFMTKCFKAMVESRNAELTLQLSKEKNLADMEEIQHKLDTAWLWCRDKITDALKSSSKGNPSMQGNAVFALASLVLTVDRYYAAKKSSDSGEKESSDSEYLGMSHWTLMTLDTIICIANPNHKPSGRIFSWCQFKSVSGTGRLSTTQLGRICAIHALPLLANVAVPTYNAKILDVLSFLRMNLAEITVDSSDKGFLFHISLSLGNILSVLNKENFQELSGPEGYSAISECFKILQGIVMGYESEEKEDAGPLLGYGMALASEFQCANLERKLGLRRSLENLLKMHENADDHSPLYTQILCTVLCWCYISAFATNVIDSKQTHALIAMIKTQSNEKVHNIELSEMLGTLYNGLFLSGDMEIMKDMNEAFEIWYSSVTKDNIPTRERLSSLTGISALVGSNSTFLPIACDVAMLNTSFYQTKLIAVTKVLRHLSRNSKDIGVPSRCLRLLGQFYLSFETSSNVISSMMPNSYDYLPTTSVLRHVVKFLTEACQTQNPEPHIINAIEVVLKCISCTARDHLLPPINWATILAPILTGKYRVEAKNNCFRIALAQCAKNVTAALLLSNWISQPRFSTLSITSLTLLYENLSNLIQCQTEEKITWFTDKAVSHCVESLQTVTNMNEAMFTAVLTGLYESLKLSNLSEGMSTILYNATEQAFVQMPYNSCVSAHNKAMWMLARCLELHPEAKTVVSMQERETDNHLKLLMLRCCCTLNGSHPLGMCNNIIEKCGRQINDTQQQEALWIIAVCLQGISEKKNTSVKISWMQETMQRMKILLASASDRELLVFLLRIFATSIVCWSHYGVCLGVPNNFYQISNTPDDEMLYDSMDKGVLWNQTMLLLPVALPRLLSFPEWENITERLIDWMIMLIQSLGESDPTTDWLPVLRNAIYSLRNTHSYKLPSVWCKAVANLHKI